MISAELRVELDGEELTVRLESAREAIDVTTLEGHTIDLPDDARAAARRLAFRVYRAADAALGGGAA